MNLIHFLNFQGGIPPPPADPRMLNNTFRETYFVCLGGGVAAIKFGFFFNTDSKVSDEAKCAS